MDMIESISKLDIQSNSIIILRVSAQTLVEELRSTIEELNEWLEGHGLFDVHIFIVSGKEFHVDMFSQEEMNAVGWFRKDDL